MICTLSLHDALPICVYKDRHQRLWFGTLDGGVCVYHAETDAFQHYTTITGLANNNVYGILEDDAGFIWLRDRKSTRLNSSHVKISYAVFCLKKKIVN